MTTFLQLRSATSGAPFVGHNQNDAVLWDTTARAWYVGAIAAPDPVALRAKWCFRVGTTFLDNASTGVIFGDSADPYVDVVAGDTIFVPPIFAFAPPFHAGPAAPQFGGIYIVQEVIDTQTLQVTRDPRMATAAQIAATTLVSADQGDGAAFYQVATPAAAVIDVDPQVMPMVAIPPLESGDTYFLISQSSLLHWQIGSVNGP